MKEPRFKDLPKYEKKLKYKKKNVEADERTVVQRSRYFVTPPRMSSWPLLNKLSCCCSAAVAGC